MFLVPQHLPRTGGENLSSDIPERDPVLDLLQPLLDQGESSEFTGTQVKGVRESLERAVNDNKGNTHELVINNFPSISSQIQLSTTLHSDIASVRDKVSSLEAQIDHSDSQTSFLPPLITSLNRHFSASSSRSAAQAHIKALKTLSQHTDRIKKLEDAVWSGKSADEWVLDDIQNEKGYNITDEDMEGEEILKGTKIMKAIEAKETLLKSMVTEQITEGFNTAVSFAHTSGQGATLSVQNQITLPHPRTTRPNHLNPSSPPHYPLPDIYSALSRLALLEGLLQTLLIKLQKDIIRPIVSSSHGISISSTDKLSILRLERNHGSSPQEVLEGVKSVLEFTSNTILPASCNISERSGFISSLTRSAFQSILDSLILPSLPPTLSGISNWLTTLQQAVETESTFSNNGSEVIKPFFDTEAGITWAQQRRYAVAEEVRRLILGGWGGWESTEKEMDKEVITYVEVEVDEPMSVDIPSIDAQKGEDGEENFGWGLDDSPKNQNGKIEPSSGNAKTQIPNDEDVSMEDDGWGFDESSAAGPSSPPKPAPIAPAASSIPAEEEEADGWDLDPSPPEPASIAEPEPQPTAITVPEPTPKPAKPAREAKRLGKKVAKVKQEEEYDPWASPDPGEEIPKATNGFPHIPQSLPTPVKAPSPPPAAQDHNKAEDGWGWDDDPTTEPKSVSGVSAITPNVSEPVMPKKRKEIREEKTTIKERYLVSTACETLMGIAQSVLRDIEQMESIDPPSPSFNSINLEPILIEAINEIFTFYRALLPTHFFQQLKDVPSLAMQAYNDSIYLSNLISKFDDNDNISKNLIEEKENLIQLSEHLFENQIVLQRDLLVESLDELNELQSTNEDKIYKKDEKIIKAIIHDLESLNRVIKPVLPTSKYLEIISYLISNLINRLTNDILNLGDITEVESNRLTDLFKYIHELENLFESHGGIVRYVGGWLKFCYISEILQASLVDITYLIDSGSLIDFTSDELIGLVRALFAISEKRDSVIEKIEREGTGGGVKE